MDIIMIRHGETEDNIGKIFSRDNTGLTEKGKQQISSAKKLLSEFNYNSVYYSPLNRTCQSIEVLGLEGISEDRIREIDFGVFTGKTFKEIGSLYPVESADWISDPINYKIPEGESVMDLYERISEFLEEIANIGESVLLVCHDCVIRLALCWVFENPDYFFRFKVENGSINIISIDDNYKYIKKTNYKYSLN